MQHCYYRYALNVGFNLQNKTIFNYFPFPWTVSAVHVTVGLAYCTVAYFLGAKNASFQRVGTRHSSSLQKLERSKEAGCCCHLSAMFYTLSVCVCVRTCLLHATRFLLQSSVLSAEQCLVCTSFVYVPI